MEEATLFSSFSLGHAQRRYAFLLKLSCVTTTTIAAVEWREDAG
jgi:hypothetical protein